ncbi:MAG: NAD(P)/FAD-dependent oxidoreductase [Rhodococcus sp. (in: high G+C Gram-positive bacteria)]
MSIRSIVIVGASLAGARAAQALRTKGFDGEVRLIGAERHAPYDRPPLSKGVLTGKTTDTALFGTEYWAEQQIELHLGEPVVALHPTERRVELADGATLDADRVLLCTGGAARRLDVPGADLDGVFCLRTADDAAGVKERLVEGANVVVIGAGFIGAEVAASARGLGCAVTIIEIAEVPLGRVLGEEMGRFYGQVHRDHGVTLRLGVGITEIVGGTGASVRAVVLTDGTTIPADVVVVGIGIVPSTELAAGIGAEVADSAPGGIIVDDFCETSVQGVFAAGDVANHHNAILGERVRLEHWRNAQNQAAAAAGSMLGERTPFCEVPWFWSDQYDLALQMAGHPSSLDDVVRRGEPGAGPFSFVYLRDGVVRAVLGVNRPSDVRAGMDLIEAGARVDPAVLVDPGTDLRKLARAAKAAATSSPKKTERVAL